MLRFGNSYIDRVANHADILLFKRKKTEGKVKVGLSKMSFVQGRKASKGTCWMVGRVFLYELESLVSLTLNETSTFVFGKKLHFMPRF